MLLINLECAIAKNGTSWDKTPKLFFFRADPHAIDVLKIAGVNYVSLANNHTLDFYYVGHEEKNDQQLLFLVMVSREKIKRVEMIPVEISKCQVAKGDVQCYDAS